MACSSAPTRLASGPASGAGWSTEAKVLNDAVVSGQPVAAVSTVSRPSRAGSQVPSGVTQASSSPAASSAASMWARVCGVSPSRGSSSRHSGVPSGPAGGRCRRR